ncbi:hypothetical protein JB92DRAFT_1271465 [Gautieria morchelliformis]|nr:hypothetical protein JB92DRAFT_1271465 [Gautieria morchelliformis]
MNSTTPPLTPCESIAPALTLVDAPPPSANPAVVPFCEPDDSDHPPTVRRRAKKSDEKELCPICLKYLTYLRRHVLNVHKGKGKVPCNGCGYTFARVDALVRHLRKKGVCPGREKKKKQKGRSKSPGSRKRTGKQNSGGTPAYREEQVASQPDDLRASYTVHSRAEGRRKWRESRKRIGQYNSAHTPAYQEEQVASQPHDFGVEHYAMTPCGLSGGYQDEHHGP